MIFFFASSANYCHRFYLFEGRKNTFFCCFVVIYIGRSRFVHSSKNIRNETKHSNVGTNKHSNLNRYNRCWGWWWWSVWWLRSGTTTITNYYYYQINFFFFAESNQIKEMMMMTIGLEHFHHHHHRNHRPKPEHSFYFGWFAFIQKRIGPRIRAYWPIISN